MVELEKNVPAEPQTESGEGRTLSAEEIGSLAKELGDALGEKSGKPLQQIAMLIEKCGLAFVKGIMAETEATEKAGGLRTQDGKRRRTMGGVFFFLAKGQMDPQYRTDIFPNLVRHGDGSIMPEGLDWEDRIVHMKALREKPGQVNNLSVTLIGRPGELHIEGSSVMTVIKQEQVKAPPYPKGVPPFSAVDGGTDYYVFMGLRHWQKVEKALENENDMLIVEGSAVYDAQLEGITILSTGVTTKVLEQQKRLGKGQARASQSQHGAAAASGGKTTKPATILPRPDLSGLPDADADKLRQLFNAADKLRQKIATMEDKGQTSGLTMTRRLLDQTEKQIATYSRQHGL